MRILRLLASFILFSLSFSAVADCEFNQAAAFANYQIRVYTDGDSCSLQTYQIVVQSGGRIVKAVAKQSEPIKNMWVTDLDRDGLFEVVIFSASVETGEYGELVLHEWTGNDFSSRFTPPLSVAQQQGYRGFDNYRIYQNQLVHEFPVYNIGDKACCASGGKRQSVYQYRNNNIEQVASNLIN
ncbi:hypothetical protein [Candidatus Albibeggiatoa sp. nov. NOAA]|uniref:hypothetical protein n=1 Tax=Candidatus Albibeggiatoa sp. nov. NOAA TaxID=3162724 RepID=UPI0032F7A027|nr:hypothetical protein [Thiotrichaceae bacterium]